MIKAVVFDLVETLVTDAAEVKGKDLDEELSRPLVKQVKRLITSLTQLLKVVEPSAWRQPSKRNTSAPILTEVKKSRN